MYEKLDRIRRILKRWFAPGAPRRQDIAKYGGLAKGLFTTRPDEIDCGECFERLDRFAEMIVAGESPSRAMPLVQDHLERCPDCREEFLSLVAALQENSAGEMRRTFASRAIP